MHTVIFRFPTLIAIACVFLNVDFVIMPVLSELGVRGWTLFGSAVFAATGEVLYWQWYAGWLGRHIRDAGSSRRAAEHFVEEGFLGRLKNLLTRAKDIGLDLRDWWGEHAIDHMKVNTPIKKRLLNDAQHIVKNTHLFMMYPLMIGFGSVPLGWAVGIALNKINRAPGAFILMLCVNALKAWGFGLLYLWMPLWSKLSIWGFLFLLLVIQVRRIVKNNGEQLRTKEKIFQ